MFTNYAEVASLAIGLVLPALVAVFTRPSTNSTVKASAHAVLSVATGSLAVYQSDPSHFVWAPAVTAAFLAWLSGTTFYHSLLKKYSWFEGLQNLFVAKAGLVLNTDSHQIETYFLAAQEVERSEEAAGIVTDFPLSTDGALQTFETEAVPAIAVQAAETADEAV
jgi:hypothetical protein